MTQTNRSEHPAAEAVHRRGALAADEADCVLAAEVRDPRGGSSPVRALVDRRLELHEGIDEDRRAGSRRHERISRGQHALAAVLPALDGLVLFWFLVAILNVDVRRPDVTVLVAAVLAALASIAVGAWNSRLGHHLQTFIDDHRRIPWGGLDVTTLVMLVATGMMWLALGTMMALRVAEEVYQATGRHDVTGWVIAGALAWALVLVNAYVLHLALSDGSAQTRELDALGAVLRRPLRQLERLRRRAARLRHGTLGAAAGLARPGELPVELGTQRLTAVPASDDRPTT